MSRKKVLITGATGFVGGYIVEEAHKNGLDIYVTVRSSSNKEYIEEYAPQYIQTNLLDSQSLIQVLSKHNFDYIIHNAGITKAKDKKGYVDFNFGSVKALTDAINTLDKKPKLTFISSLAACGPADDKNGIIKPNSPCTPVTYYGESKLLAEQYIQNSAHFEWSIIRPTAVYGPREKDLLTVFQTVNKGINAKLGKGDKKLTFIYVKDLAKLVLAATLKGTKEIYLAAYNKTYSEDDLASFIADSLNKKPFKITIPIKVVSVIATINEIYAKTFDKVTILNKNKMNELNAQNWTCDITNTEQLQPLSTSLKEGIKETTQWYVDQNWL